MQHIEYLHHVFSMLRNQKLYANLKKWRFFTHNLVFLGYVVSKDGIMMDPCKVEAILNGPTPKTLHDMQNFHGFAYFYRRYIKEFNFIIAPITKCLKWDVFKCTNETQNSFGVVKKKVIKTPVLSLPNFNKMFE